MTPPEETLDPPVADRKAPRHVMPASRFRRAQRQHFAVGVLLPTALAVLLPWFVPAIRQHAAAGGLLWLVSWTLVGGFGVSVGLHRLFAHHAFSATPACRWLLGILGCMAVQGPVTYWVALHRMHHTYSDAPGDPHSPSPEAWAGTPSRLAAFCQGHIGWVWSHDLPKPQRYARDLQADPAVRWVDRHYPVWVLAGYVLPALAGGALLRSAEGLWVGLYWGGVLRVALGHHIVWAINSWCHAAGNRPHDTADRSTNVAALALLSFGESWHNNHHHQPTSARFGNGPRQPDPGFLFIRGLQRVGLATAVRQGATRLD